MHGGRRVARLRDLHDDLRLDDAAAFEVHRHWKSMALLHGCFSPINMKCVPDPGRILIDVLGSKAISAPGWHCGRRSGSN
jgi:hypothetical protein